MLPGVRNARVSRRATKVNELDYCALEWPDIALIRKLAVDKAGFYSVLASL